LTGRAVYLILQREKMNKNNPSKCSYLDEKCRRVEMPSDGVFEEFSTDDSTNLRCISSNWAKLINIHCSTKSGWSIGIADDGDTRTICSWSLTYESSGSRWRGKNSNFEVFVHRNTCRDDLKTLLDSFDRVATNSQVMEQPRGFVMNIGFQTSQDFIAKTYVRAGIIEWNADRQGLIYAAALDDGNVISTLDHIVYHEATHLMEPEMQQSLGELTNLISNSKTIDWNGVEVDVFLPPVAEKAISSINPDYLPSKLHIWREAMEGLQSQHHTGTISDAQFKTQSHAMDEDLAAEILVETTCSLFWNSGKVPFPKEGWPELDAIAEATVDRMKKLSSISLDERRATYESRSQQEPVRDVVRVLILPAKLTPSPSQAATGLAGIAD